MLSLILLLIPLCCAALVLVGPKKGSATFATVLSVLNLGFTVWAYTQFTTFGSADFAVDYPWIDWPSIHFRLTTDGISMLMILLTNITMPFILLSSQQRETQGSRTFHALILLAQFALLGVFMADDAVLYYVFWELTLIPAYFILMGWGGANRGPVTIKFFIYTLAGSLFMLLAFIYLYFKSGAMQPLSSGAMTGIPMNGHQQALVFGAFMLAFAIKLPLIPLHTWQADTYREAPSQGTMILSALMAKMALFSIVRWLLPAVPGAVSQYGSTVMVVALIGTVYAGIIAIQQNDIKRLFAYASLSHIGIMVAGIFSLNAEGMQGAFIQAFAHGINTIGLFVCADILQNRLGTTELGRMGGIRTAAPKFTTVFFIVMFAAVALPFTNSFVAEVVVLYGIFEYNIFLAVLGTLSLVLGAVYMLRMLRRALLGESNAQTASFADLSVSEKLVLYPIVVLIFLFGIWYQPLFKLTEAPVAELLSKIVMPL